MNFGKVLLLFFGFTLVTLSIDNAARKLNDIAAELRALREQRSTPEQTNLLTSKF